MDNFCISCGKDGHTYIDCEIVPFFETLSNAMTLPDILKPEIPKQLTVINCCAFVEWMNYNCVRAGEHEWTYRGDNYKNRHSTSELLTIWKII